MESTNPCNGCDHCCRHIALEIDEPETIEEFDQIRWFLLHNDVWVFIDHDDSWNLQVNTRCEKLVDGLCTYYEDRPQICRDYEPDNCERHGEGDSYKLLWKTVEQFESWMGEGKIIPDSLEEDEVEEVEEDLVEDAEEEGTIEDLDSDENFFIEVKGEEDP